MELVVGSFLAGNKITKCLYTSKTKGAVYSAYKVAEREEKDNFSACRILADCLGWTYVLLPRSLEPNVKTADMMRLEYSTVVVRV